MECATKRQDMLRHVILVSATPPIRYAARQCLAVLQSGPKFVMRHEPHGVACVAKPNALFNTQDLYCECVILKKENPSSLINNHQKVKPVRGL